MKLRSKLLLSISVLILAVIAAIVIIINRLQEQSILEDRRTSAFDLAYVLAHSSVQAIVADDYLVLQEILDSVHSKRDIIQAMILDTTGKILVHNETRLIGLTTQDPLALEASRSTTERSLRIRYEETKPAWDVSVPILIVNEQAGTARVIYSLESAYNDIHRTRNTVLAIGAVAFVVGILLSVLLGRVIVRPLYILVEATRRIGRGDLSHRVQLESGDEIGELARSFDHMADGLVERDRQLAEKMAQLLELTRYNQNILQSMSSGVITVDLQGNIVTFNRSAENITGLRGDEVRGNDIRTVFSTDPLFSNTITDTLTSGEKRQNVEMRHKTLQGDVVILQVNTRLLRNVNGENIGVLTVFNDLTELKKLEEDMKRAERLAALGTTAASIAHEIRTPLTSLSTFAELLPVKYNDPKFRERFQAIVPGQVDRLTNLVNDLLDFSRVETLHFEETSINPLVKDAAELLTGKAEECGVTIAMNLLPDLPPARVDPDHISQVFLNIIQNALQAMSEGGRLDITTAIHDHDPSEVGVDVTASFRNGHIRIFFTDTGIGIAEENIEKLFEPFFTTRSKGTGLGLAISYRIVKEHGGTIAVVSEPGRGTTFAVCLPIQT